MDTLTATPTPRPTTPAGLAPQAPRPANPREVIEAALGALVADPEALLDPSVCDALRAVRAASPAEYERILARAKEVNDKAQLPELEEESGGADDAHDLLAGIATERCRLCHDADRRGVAIIEAEDHREVWFVRSAGFADWLRAEYFNSAGKAASPSKLKSAIATIEAMGLYRGEQVEVHLRCAKEGESYFVDLCDGRWRAVRIDRSGYEVLERSAVLFTRNGQMRALPLPEPSENLERLWKYANVSPAQRPLVVAWLLDSMRPDTAFPVLEISGEQGSAKSTTQRTLRELIDPNKAALRGAPKTTEDIYVAAASSWVVSYENLSGIADEKQDVLCTLSTGGGFGTRRFFTNGEENVLHTKRPVMLNGISSVATRPDLVDRLVHVDAPSIPERDRRADADLAKDWKRDYALVFGALLDRFAKALRALEAVELKRHQRMADYERLGEAMMRSQGRAAGEFSALYARAVDEGAERSLENYGVAQALLSLMNTPAVKRKGKWSGSVGTLYLKLGTLKQTDGSNWPRSARGLSDQLKRLTLALRKQGLDIVFGRKTNAGRQVTITDKRIGSPSRRR